MTLVSARTARRSWAAPAKRVFSACFSNAGRTYITGDVLALAAAAVTALDGREGSGFVVSLGHMFLGGAPAVAVTLGTITYFFSGATYSRAFRTPAPDIRVLRSGHAISTVGALLMALGVAGLATSRFAFGAALFGGALHAGGKLGAALGGTSRVWKLLPLLSRLPALASLAVDIAADPTTTRAAGAALLWLCVLIWARADAMLLREG